MTHMKQYSVSYLIAISVHYANVFSMERGAVQANDIT